MKKERLWLVLILLLTSFLRFWQLGQVPASPDWDEASLGYNAYSILKTGRDEYGIKYPLFLKSFGDYKPALYAYLSILPIKVFGLNLFSVRFPAAFFGTISVLIVYFLIKEVFKNSRLALIGSFLLAISPWHLQFSRAAFESNIGVLVNMLMVVIFLRSFKKPILLPLAAFFAGLNLYTYQAEKIFTPLLVLALFLIWRRQLLKINRRFLVSAIIVGLLTVAPFIYQTLNTPEMLTRAKGTSFASDQTRFLSRTAVKLIRDQENNYFLGSVLDNRRITYILKFISGYLSHFDLNWLFITGDDTRHHAPGMGLLYLWELPFFLWGIYTLIFKKNFQQPKKLIFSWFLLAPIPAAFTSGVPHAVRTMRFLPMVHIFTAIGLLEFWRRRQKILTLVVAGFFIFNFTYFLNQYFVQLNYFTSWTWQYGYQPAIEKILPIEEKYEQIVVSNLAPMDQSYIFFLFHLAYDPVTYQAEGGTISGSFVEETNSFDKYIFRQIDWANEEKRPEILYVGRPNDFPEDIGVLHLVNFLNGEPAIKIVQGQ